MEIEKMMASKLKVGKESCSKIPNPKHSRGLHKPHIFALQEGKMFWKSPWNKDSQVPLGEDQFQSKTHLYGWVFKAQESVPNGKVDQPVHTPHQQCRGSLRKWDFSFATRSTGKENKDFFWKVYSFQTGCWENNHYGMGCLIAFTFTWSQVNWLRGRRGRKNRNHLRPRRVFCWAVYLSATGAGPLSPGRCMEKVGWPGRAHVPGLKGINANLLWAL